MEATLTICADRRLDGPFTFGRQVVRTLTKDGIPPQHTKEQLVLAFVDPATPADAEGVPLLLSIPHDERLQVLPAAHLTFLCHAIAEVLEYRGLPQIQVCHITEADETDRELIRVLAERARFHQRPVPVRVVECDHQGPVTAAPDAGALLLDAVRLGYFETALRCGHSLIEESEWPSDYDPDFHAHLRAYTNALSAVGRPLEAVALYEAAAERWDEPSLRATAHYVRAMFHTRHGGPAERNLDRAVKSIRLAIAAAESIEDPVGRCRRVAFFENSLALIEMLNGDLGRALDRMEAGLAVLDRGGQQENQHRMKLRHNRAIVLFRLGRIDEAMDDLNFAVACDPASAGPLVDRAMALRASGRAKEALADLTYAIEHCVCGPEAYSNRAILQVEQGDLASALEDLRWARLLDNSDDEIFIQLLETLIDAELFDQAAELLTERTDSEESEQIIALRARLAVAREDVTAALAVLDAGLDAHPDAVLLRLERSTVLHLLQRPAEALADLETAIAKDEFNPVIEANRILLLRECRREAEAQAAAVRLLDRDLQDDVRGHVQMLIAAPE